MMPGNLSFKVLNPAVNPKDEVMFRFFRGGIFLWRNFMSKFVFTSESVTEGHPDKVCDIISDSILDEIIKSDPEARVACETFCTTGMVNVMGEITTTANFDVPKIVRKAVSEIGHVSSDMGFDANTCAVLSAIDEQSPDIAMGVDKSLELKSGEDDD